MVFFGNVARSGNKIHSLFHTKEYLFSSHKIIRTSTRNNTDIVPMFQIEARSIMKAMW